MYYVQMDVCRQGCVYVSSCMDVVYLLVLILFTFLSVPQCCIHVFLLFFVVAVICFIDVDGGWMAGGIVGWWMDRWLVS